MFVPHIIHPTRVTPTSKTIIDNIFSNNTNYEDGISGNITVSLSDHLAQFLIIPEECNRSIKKLNQYTRDLKSFDELNFFHDLHEIDWTDELKLNLNDPNIAFAGLQLKVNDIINHYFPERKMTRNEIKRKLKPWITNEVLKLIKQRDKLKKHFVRAKDMVIKELFHTRYKELRNLIVALCRLNKKEYYQSYFTANSNNLRNTWRGIKSIINLNGKDQTYPTSILIKKELITSPIDIANEFNNYFSNIASKLQSSIHYQGQDFNDYLYDKVERCLFIKPTDKYEIIDTINNNIGKKAYGPNSIPNMI